MRHDRARMRAALCCAALLLAACGGGAGDQGLTSEAPTATSPPSDETPTPAEEPTVDEAAVASPTVAPIDDAEEPESGESEQDGRDAERLDLAETVIDAFYSFDAGSLEATLGDIRDAETILYYQGWAEGGNYGVLDRRPCEVASSSAVRCSITVEDDFAKTLALDFNVTDSFTFLFNEENEITMVSTSSDDPALVTEAFQWSNANRRDLLDVPCEGFFRGGPTPGECARAHVEAFADFIAQRES